MLVIALIIGGITTLIAVLMAKKMGPIVWHQAITLVPLILGWTITAACTTLGIYLLVTAPPAAVR